MPHGFENSPASGNRLFRHWAELGIRQELSSKRASHELVRRLRIVVGTVIGMSPVVVALRFRFDYLLIADVGNRIWSKRPKQFAFGDLSLGRFANQNAVGHVVRQVNNSKRAAVGEYALPEQSSLCSRLAYRVNLAAVF